MRNYLILLVTIFVVALPFLFQKSESLSNWKEGDPILVVITPHNEAVRREFGLAFSKWHEKQYGKPVKIDWRSIGGASEIMRYLEAEYVSAFRSWWLGQGKKWPLAGASMMLSSKYSRAEVNKAFRDHDSAAAFTSGVDVLFGGGAYDHGKAAAQGLLVPPWKEGAIPEGLVTTEMGQTLIPEEVNGEVWRTDVYYGTALSTFGICYNLDRLADLGIEKPPTKWQDLTSPKYYRQIGVADPTKSGSNAKAIEMIIHEQCHIAVAAAGFTNGQIRDYEKRINNAKLPPGELPPGIPPKYQEAIERGWLKGINLVRQIAANARYFTISAGKVPIDVSMGDAAAGLVIGFYGRFQAENTKSADGRQRMVYITPPGGSSVSADPISLLRGAEHRELALRFMSFVLGQAGQKLLAYRPGTPGGPTRYALRRLPIRRDFYPSKDKDLMAAFKRHEPYLSDDLASPTVDAYALADQFQYNYRWTARHFRVQRHLIRAMCLDGGHELRLAWEAILQNGGPQDNAEAMKCFEELPNKPIPLTWRSALSMTKQYDKIDYMREWTLFFRETYEKARVAAERGKAVREL